MSYVPEFVALYEIIPYIRKLPLDDETIRVAVKDYLEGGEKKDAIVKMYGPIGYWDTSEVTDMSHLFGVHPSIDHATYIKCFNFNEYIGKWNVSSVTNMKFMFCSANNFNQPIGEWDTSNVTDMKYMFKYATSFIFENAPWYHE